MEKILVSACLIGFEVRYNGAHCEKPNAWLSRWKEEGRLVSICPELAGGLRVPRPPAEIQAGRVVTSTGQDVTANFRMGAQLALELAMAHGIRFALLKEKSPSCGVRWIHDGNFGSGLLVGEGLTAKLLREAGLQVFSEHEIELLAQAIAQR